MKPESLETGAVDIVRELRAAGYDAWFVGGCVRDRLLGLPLKDIDIATNATPDEVQSLFGRVEFVGAAFGVCIVKNGWHHYEVTTFRHDGRYLDHRRPETVSFGTVEDDARRRDFTINALYQDPVTGDVLDLVGGRDDLAARRIRCVGEPRARFEEDALRLLRTIRFAARLGFDIEAGTWQAVVELAPSIVHISAERIRDELTRMLVDPSAARALELLLDSGLLAHVLPEAVALRGVEQGKTYHPEGDVWVHTLLAVARVEPRNLVTCWAALLHDIAKPVTLTRDEGGIHFFGHERVGAEMARAILGRLRFSNDDIEAIATVVKRHMMFSAMPEMRRSTLRRFLGAPTIEADLALHRADCLASNGRLDYWELARAQIAGFERAEEPVLPKPLLGGEDLKAMGYRPGPLFRQILDAVATAQLEGELADADAARRFVSEKFPG